MLSFVVPLRIIKRPERLIIQDYRPTVVQLLTMAGFLFFLTIFVLLLVFRIDSGVDSFGLWAAGAFALICFGLSLRGTLREEYVFDKPSDTYTFVRRYPHRREIIEGSLSQFRGVEVRTQVNDESESYSVVLLQDGTFLSGEMAQHLRDEVPALNTYSNESRIANAIAGFLDIKRDDPIA